jgi:hypothetical protein
MVLRKAAIFLSLIDCPMQRRFFSFAWARHYTVMAYRNSRYKRRLSAITVDVHVGMVK